MADVEDKIKALANDYSKRLNQQITDRLAEIEEDDNSHYLIYQVLGISDSEGYLIDAYQNKGRFLYRYAGSFLEAATKICFLEKFPEAGSVKIPNTRGQRPKTFEIDLLLGTEAIEIKWRDATTDGDHVTKEHTRILAVTDHNYTPIRVMFYYPNRVQAIRIQQTLETLYKGVGGYYYYDDAAWDYVRERSGINLLEIIKGIAKQNATKG